MPTGYPMADTKGDHKRIGDVSTRVLGRNMMAR